MPGFISIKDSSYLLIRLLCLVFLVSSTITEVKCQQYFTKDTVLYGSTSFPFGNNRSPKLELSYPASDFNKKPASGLIKKIWFKFIDTSSSRYANLIIGMSQGPEAKTNTFTNNVETVYGPSFTTITPKYNTWYGIELDRPFYYNPSTSLKVVLQYGNFIGNGCFLCIAEGKGVTKNMIYGTPGENIGSGYNEYLVEFGFDMVPLTGLNNAGISNIVSPVNFCKDDHNLKLTVRATNFGLNDIDSLDIGWRLDGKLQPPLHCKHKILPGKDADIILMLNYDGHTSHRIKAWTYNPGGKKDNYAGDDTLFDKKIMGDTIPPFFILYGNAVDSFLVSTPAHPSDYVDKGTGLMDNMDVSIYYLNDSLKRGGDFYTRFPDGVNPNVVGKYHITYTSTDRCGNVRSTMRTLVVYENIPPVITLKGPQVVSVCRWSPYEDAGYTVSDNHDSVQQIKVDTFGNFFTNGTSVPGSYFLRYKAVDFSGNITYSANRTVLVADANSPGCMTGTSATMPLEKSTQIYPNPNAGIFTIYTHLASDQPIKISVKNTLGQEMLQEYVSQNGSTLIYCDMTAYTNGVYFITVMAEGETITRRVLLQR